MKRVGPYRLLERLGEGGMATVHLAEDDRGRRVALKLFHPRVLKEQDFFCRFRQEADLNRRVRHPHVAAVLDADLRFDRRPVAWLALEHVDGESLRARFAREGPLPEPLLRRVGRDAATGLAALHAAGIVHRDVKPDNLVLGRDGAVRVIDLGVAAAARCDGAELSGSAAYMAPELFLGDDAGPPADLYGLGVTLYELATGRNPFADDDPAASLHRHVHHVPLAAARLRPDLTPFLDAVLAALMEKRPGDRLAPAAAVADTLHQGEASAWWSSRRPRAVPA